jgi:hypothetical protein
MKNLSEVNPKQGEIYSIKITEDGKERWVVIISENPKMIISLGKNPKPTSLFLDPVRIDKVTAKMIYQKEIDKYKNSLNDKVISKRMKKFWEVRLEEMKEFSRKYFE